MNDKNKSIYIDGLEEFINTNLVNRPYPFMAEFEQDAEVRKLPIISAATGNVLSYLVEKIKPTKILEIGTGPGYSLLWMVSVLSDCHITTIDRNPGMVKEAKQAFGKVDSGSVKVEFLHEFALEYLKNNKDKLPSFDLVFVDCDKILYPEILEILLQLHLKNIIFDNSLWHGRIINKENQLPSDNAIREFWALLKNSERRWFLFPVGDGLVLVQ